MDYKMSKDTKEMQILLAIVFASVLTLIGLLVYEYTRPTICKKVKHVYICAVVETHSSHGGTSCSTECRVELEDGTRKTTRDIVAEGDDYCWKDYE